MQANYKYLLYKLYDGQLKTRGSPAYVYLEPQALDAADFQRLEEAVRCILPADQRRALYDKRTKLKARRLARLILKVNLINPTVERYCSGGKTTTRWNLGPLQAEEHSRFLWDRPVTRENAQRTALAAVRSQRVAE